MSDIFLDAYVSSFLFIINYLSIFVRKVVAEFIIYFQGFCALKDIILSQLQVRERPHQ